MKLLLAERIIDPVIGFHYAFIRSFKLNTEMHRHDFYEFFITFGGPVNHLVNGRRQLLTDGSLVWIRPDDAHCYEPGAADSHILNVAFPRELFDNLARYAEPHESIRHIHREALPPVAHLHKRDRSNLKLRLERLALSTGNSRENRLLEFKAILMELLFKPIQGTEEREPQMPEWLISLAANMREKEHFPAGLERLYELSGKNREYVSRSFRKHFGLTPTHWLNRIKLEYAANLLQYTDEDIAGIALDCGFDNLSHFYHLFKEHFHHSPAKYRKIMQKPVIPEQS